MFGGNPLGDVSHYVRGEVQRIGEDLVGTAIDRLLANQDAHLTQLQDLQKWNLVKTVQKILSTKFFPRETPVVPVNEEASPLLHGITSVLEFSGPLGDNAYWRRPISIGDLQVRINGIDALYLPSLKAESVAARRRCRWMVNATLGKKCVESGVVRAQASDEAYEGNLRWPGGFVNLDVGPVTDLQNDLVIDVLRKAVDLTSDPQASKSGGDLGMNEWTPFFGRHEAPSTESASPESKSMSIDEVEIPKQKRDLWASHGRVVIPLTMMMVRMLEKLDDHQHPLSLKGWFHLYPKGQQESEWKFVRPCPGYAALGMVNPISSLGFVNLELVFTPRNARLPLLPIISNWNTPQAIWNLPTRLDLQAFEIAGLRLHHSMHSIPFWIKRYFHVGSAAHQYSRLLGQYDFILFWMLLSFGLIVCELSYTPLVGGACVLIISYSYRRNPTETSTTLFYRDPPIPAPGSPGRFKPKTLAGTLGSKSTKVGNYLTNWMNHIVLDLSSPRDSSGPKPSANRMSNAGAGPVPSILLPGPAPPPSSIATIFGRADIGVQDTSSYISDYPIFFGELPDVDLMSLKHLGLVILEGVQLLFVSVSSLTEKIKFAFDWSCPMTSLVSCFIIMVVSVQLCISLILLRRVPSPLIRLFILWLPVVAPLSLTDPVLFKSSGIAQALDRFTLSMVAWQPESSLVLRFSQNAWDLLYLCRIISLKQHEERCSAAQAYVQSSPAGRGDSVLSSQGPFGDLPPSSFVPVGSPVPVASPVPGRPPPPGVCISPHRETLSGSAPPGEVILRKRRLVGADSPSLEPIAVGVVTASATVMRSESSAAVPFYAGQVHAVELALFPLRWLICNVICRFILLEIRFVWFWFLRLPDRREIEHRQICATQYMGEALDPFVEARLGHGADLNKYYEQAAKELVQRTPLGASAKPHGSPRHDGAVAKKGGATGFNKLLAQGFQFPNTTSEADPSSGGSPPAWYTAAGARRNVETMTANWVKTMRRGDYPPAIRGRDQARGENGGGGKFSFSRSRSVSQGKDKRSRSQSTQVRLKKGSVDRRRSHDGQTTPKKAPATGSPWLTRDKRLSNSLRLWNPGPTTRGDGANTLWMFGNKFRKGE